MDLWLDTVGTPFVGVVQCDAVLCKDERVAAAHTLEVADQAQCVIDTLVYVGRLQVDELGGDAVQQPEEPGVVLARLLGLLALLNVSQRSLGADRTAIVVVREMCVRRRICHAPVLRLQPKLEIRHLALRLKRGPERVSIVRVPVELLDRLSDDLFSRVTGVALYRRAYLQHGTVHVRLVVDIPDVLEHFAVLLLASACRPLRFCPIRNVANGCDSVRAFFVREHLAGNLGRKQRAVFAGELGLVCGLVTCAYRLGYPLTILGTCERRAWPSDKLLARVSHD